MERKIAIEIDKLYKQYKHTDNFVVKGISLSIPEHEIFGLLGPNGAGKTTLLSMMYGLLKPTSGKITVFSESYSNHKTDIHKQIGVVPQEYALYPALTARENITYFASMYGLKGEDLNQNINQTLERLGLLQFADKKIGTFSGGMKRRINLIASVLHRPKILFLDEPTVGVDVQSKNVIIEYLQELNQLGTTIIYTSHHLSEAENFCTQIAIIDRGEIFACDTPKRLIQNTENASNLEDVFIYLTGKQLRDDI